MERNSFIFYKGWREAIKDLPDDVRLEIYESIIEYATTGNLRGLKPMANIAFNFIVCILICIIFWFNYNAIISCTLIFI